MDLNRRAFVAQQDRKRHKWKREDEVRVAGMNLPNFNQTPAVITKTPAPDAENEDNEGERVPEPEPEPEPRETFTRIGSRVRKHMQPLITPPRNPRNGQNVWLHVNDKYEGMI